MMAWNYPATRKQVLTTGFFFVAGVVMMAIGGHLSFVNIAPQQARAKARRDFVVEYLKRKFPDKP
ncbi:hypothetical protein KFK09_018731 [Dendrobium nobile]|uniref:Uncharacterized protein n=2 Tax=Dendrobium TaxID=37818 RepID=A0A8T3AWK8_DENNO|nr:hypothetical protein KFK09_018731 [Dendrobium nobile]PKU75867.1 hypothetical protein MA16_Dca005914 [Dendrobium catenatum]